MPKRIIARRLPSTKRTTWQPYPNTITGNTNEFFSISSFTFARFMSLCMSYNTSVLVSRFCGDCTFYISYSNKGGTIRLTWLCRSLHTAPHQKRLPLVLIVGLCCVLYVVPGSRCASFSFILSALSFNHKPIWINRNRKKLSEDFSNLCGEWREKKEVWI